MRKYQQKNITLCIRYLIYFFKYFFQLGVLFHNQQIRNKWPDFKMKKDARKRNTLKEYGVYKLRYNALRKNDIIPIEIQVNK